MKTSKLIGALIAGGLVGLASLSCHAAGLGRLTVQSSLGQPLQAEIELLSVQKGELDSLAARVAAQDAFQEAKIDYSPILNSVRFSVEKRANGQSYLKVTTTQPVNDPFIDMLVELTWASGRLLREFPVLLDPPGFAASKPAPAVAQPAPAKPAAATPPARPAKPVAAATAAAPTEATGDQYTVKSGDTLYRVAGQIKPAEVNLDQMVVALFRENRQAFVGENMNRMKSGARLHVPTAEQATAVSQSDATREIRAQAADWNAYRAKLAGQVAAAPAQPDTSSQSAAGKIGKAAVEQPAAPSAAPKDVLKLSKGAESKAGTTIGASEDKATALREEATAREGQTKEQKARIAQLGKNIQEMQQLLTMKNQSMAELQKQAEAGKSVPRAAPAEKPAIEAKPAPDVKPPVDAKPTAEAKAPQEAKPAPVLSAEPPAAPAQVAPAAESEPAADAKPQAVPKKAAPPPPSPEPSFLDEVLENPLYKIAGIAILALLGFLGYGAYKRRKVVVPMTTTGATSSLASDLKSGTMPSAKSSGVVDTGNSSFLTDFEKTGPGIIDIEEVDPVAEAEVYIAYGRDAQAEEILKEAMAKDTSRHEIPLKLLEIYSARKSAASFEAVAKDLHRSVGSTHPIWNRVAEMGRGLDPTNALYVAGGTVAARHMAQAAQAPRTEAPTIPEEGGPTSAELVSHGHGVDLDLNQLSSPKTRHETTSPPAGASMLDLPLESQVPAEKTPTESNVLDFDLGGIGVRQPVGDRPEPPAAEQTLVTRPKFTDDDLDLTVFNASAAAAGTPPASPRDSAVSRLEVALPNLALHSHEPIIPATIDTVSKRPASTPDLGGLNLDLSPASVSLETSTENGAESDWQNVATKLDLARAYLEIGDRDGAREILEEVMQEGDAEQKREAGVLTAAMH